MSSYTLPYFEPLESTNLEPYYDVDIEFNGRQIQIDLNFDEKEIDASRLDTVKRFIENIQKFDEQNKTYFLDDYNDEEGDTVKFYLEEFWAEIDQEQFSEATGFEAGDDEPERRLLEKLHLVRVGLYPDNDDVFAIFDYSIGTDFTNYLIVINTDEKGEMDYMTMES